MLMPKYVQPHESLGKPRFESGRNSRMMPPTTATDMPFITKYVKSIWKPGTDTGIIQEQDPSQQLYYTFRKFLGGQIILEKHTCHKVKSQLSFPVTNKKYVLCHHQNSLAAGAALFCKDNLETHHVQRRCKARDDHQKISQQWHRPIAGTTMTGFHVTSGS